MLLLTTPAQHDADNPDVLRNVGQLKQWVSQLPVMDVLETVRRLHGAIQPFNELRLADAERLKLLEVYRQALEDILFSYDEFRLRLLPLPAQDRNVLAEDIMWLYLDLANGYKMLVLNSHEQGLSPAHDALTLRAVYRAMELIVHALVYAQRAQRPAPPLARLELNQLYRLAETHGVLQTRVRAVRRETTMPTIDRVFKQYWVLAAAGSERWSGVELLELFVSLEAFAADSRLGTERPEGRRNGVYALDLFSDDPAVPGEQSGALQEPRFLDLNPMARSIAAWLAEQRDQQHEFVAQESRLLRMFVESQGLAGGRRSLRRPQDRAVKVALGMDAVHYFFGDARRLADACEAEVCGGIEVQSFEQDEAAAYLSRHWAIKDESDTGCLLQGSVMDGDEFPALGSVLGVVGFVLAAASPVMSVGLVRWQGQLDNGQHKLGVEIIAGGAVSVLVSRSSPGLDEDPTRAIYFPKEAAIGRPASLLLPRELADAGEPLWIDVRGKRFRFEAAATLLETPLYRQLRFRVLR